MTETLIQAISACLLALSVLYAARQVLLLRRQHEDNHDWNRRLAAQHAIRQYTEIQAFVETLSKHFNYHNLAEGIPAADFEEKFNEFKALQTRLHAVLSYFEGLARGIRQGIYDDEVVKNAFRGLMMRVFESFRYYIETRRREHHNPRLYVEFEEICETWRKKERIIDPPRQKIAEDS